MSIADLIKNAATKNASAFEDEFNEIMSDKMTAAIGNKYNSMFGSEEVDGGEEVLPEVETEEQDEE